MENLWENNSDKIVVCYLKFWILHFVCTTYSNCCDLCEFYAVFPEDSSNKLHLFYEKDTKYLQTPLIEYKDGARNSVFFSFIYKVFNSNNKIKWLLQYFGTQKELLRES